jgi:hypothetical protein
MSTDYACVALIDRGTLTLRRLRADFANPARLVGCGEFPRLAARNLLITRQGDRIELRFTITHTRDIADAAQRAAELVRILTRGQTPHIPFGTVAVSPQPATPAAASQPPAPETGEDTVCLTTLAAIKRACQPGARLEIVSTDLEHLNLTRAQAPRRIEKAQTNAIAVRGCHPHGGDEFDPDVISWLYWPKVAEIEFHGDDTFTLTGLARYRVLRGACARCEHELVGDGQTLCRECEDTDVSDAAPGAVTAAQFTATLDIAYDPEPDRDGDPFTRVAEEFDGDLKDLGATWAVRVTDSRSGESRLIDTADWSVLDDARSHRAAA